MLFLQGLESLLQISGPEPLQSADPSLNGSISPLRSSSRQFEEITPEVTASPSAGFAPSQSNSRSTPRLLTRSGLGSLIKR